MSMHSEPWPRAIRAAHAARAARGLRPAQPLAHVLAVLLWGLGACTSSPAPLTETDAWLAGPDRAAEGLALGAPAFAAPVAWVGPGLPFPSAENPWPAIREERIRSLLGPAMDRAGVDAWALFVRENHNDPLAHHVGAENAGGLAAFLFFRDPAGRGGSIFAHALTPGGEATALRDAGIHDEVEVLSGGESAWAAAARVLASRNPRRIAINVSNLAVADGLSHTQYQALIGALPAELASRLTSSEELVIQWLSVKTEQEVDILTRAAEITAALEIEAYSRVVPGRTRDADVAAYLKARMAQLGVGDAWAPEQNPNVNSGADRGHSHATDRVIEPGDIIQTDFGIRVWDLWVTDIQRFAYVLAPGETEPPPAMETRWQSARAGARAAFDAMRPGVRGVDVDQAQRTVMDQAGSLDVFWSTGHPVGYWAHDVGPSLGGAQRGRTPSVHAQRPLLPGQVFAFDGFFSWYLDEDPPGPEFPAVDPSRPTKTISVEEMVVITEDGARWLVPPQENLILIPSQSQNR
jgi:Xaa-Pro dipeptidase